MGRQIAANTPEMVQGIKQILQADLDRSWREMYDAEGEARRTTHIPLTTEVGFAEFLSRKGRL